MQSQTQTEQILMDALHALPHVYVTVLYVLLGIIATLCIIYPILSLISFLRARSQDTVFLAVTPPSFSHKTPLATEQLTRILQSLIAGRTLKDRLILRHRIASMELVSTRSDGIRFIFGLPKADAPVFTQQLTAYLPDVTVKEVSDPVASLQTGRQYFKEFNQVRHFAYPLASNDTLAQHDPIAYINSAMTRHRPNEHVVYQIVLSAIYPHSVTLTRNKLAIGQDPDLYGTATPLPVLFRLCLIKFPVHSYTFAVSHIVE